MRNKQKISNPKEIRNSYRGFTIIELIVAFSIMAALSTIGVASFVSYSRAQTLQQAENDLVSVLNTAKSNSIAQVKPDDLNCLPVSGEEVVLNGYKVILDRTTNSYTLYAICNGNDVPIAPATSTTPTAKLPNGVSFDSSMFTSPATTMTITFTVLTGGVTGNGSIILDGPTGTTSKTITITSGGLIE